MKLCPFHVSLFFTVLLFIFCLLQECILNNNNPLTRNPNIVRNAFEGACSAFVLWRSDFVSPCSFSSHFYLFISCISRCCFTDLILNFSCTSLLVTMSIGSHLSSVSKIELLCFSIRLMERTHHTTEISVMSW